MRVFVTGGSGFVGGAAIRHLAQEHDVLAMARSDASAVTVERNGARAVRCSLDGVAARHLEGCHAVIHAAAKAEAWGRWSDFERVNVAGTRRVLAAAKAAGAERFIHIGTEAALFRGQPMRDIDESYPLAPDSPFPYSATKARAELAVREANDAASGFTTLVLRPRMVWGPGDETVLAGVKRLVESGQFAWIDGGRSRTSSCYIDNLVHAIVLALEHGRGAEAYFITDDEVRTLREFLTAYLGTAGVRMPNKSLPGWLVRGLARALDPIWRLLRIEKQPPITPFEACILSVDCTLRIDKARQQLQYVPRVTVDQGMDQCRTP
ncbi:MAG: NAD-dependent epimerase/dehydratase family protein [Polyangiales bacterium]